MRRLLPALLLSMLASAGLFGAATGAGAQTDGEGARPVHIIEVKGRIDAIVANFVVRSLDTAHDDDAEVVVVQMDSPGALVDRADLDELVFRVAHAAVPVTVWIGPTGARASGGAARMVEASAYAAMAPRTRLNGLGPEAAVERDLADAVVPTIGEFLAELDGKVVNGRELDTARVVTAPDGESQTQAAGEVRFGKLPLMERLLHATASPSVAYLLLVVGLALIVFEFFSVGIGVAGATGAVLLALSAYGLAALPTRPFSLALVALGMFGFAVDVQAGAPRAWTVIGSVSLLFGSWRLFGDGIDIPWLTLLVLVVGVFFLMVSGLPSMVRSRFSTPTIGRESMIGSMGEARTAVDPEGTVALGEACGGRGPTGPLRSGRAIPSGWSPSTACCSRWNRRKAGPRTPGTRYPQAPTWAFLHLAPCGAPESGGTVADRGEKGRRVKPQRVGELWQQRAACKGPQSVVFFPPSHVERKDEREAREERAKSICAICPVRAACLDYALSHPRTPRHLGRPQRGRAQATPDE